MASSTERFDDIFFNILQNCEQIEPFLEVVFSFLARRTDFFRLMHSKADKMGFPPGVAEKMILKIFKKYQNIVSRSEEKQTQPVADAKKKKKSSPNKTPKSEESKSNVPDSTITDVPSVVETVDVQTTISEKPVEQPCIEPQPDPSTQMSSSPEALSDNKATTTSNTVEPSKAPECFNGAVLDNYMWSQTGREIDVRVPVPDTVTGKDVMVEIKNNHLKVALKTTHTDGPKVFVEGELQWRIHAEESMWTLLRGEHIHVTLDKVEDRWWTCVIKGDKEIDKSKIDTTRDIGEFDEQTQNDYEKVMFDHRQKMMGKPTRDEMKAHNMLKQAWDAPNSPFAGTPFDPSQVNISGNFNP